jgi:hypothetical protein
VRRWIANTQIGLGLNDSTRQHAAVEIVDDELAKQVGSDFLRRAVEKGTGQATCLPRDL